MLKKSLLISLFFLSCARQIAPSGGPDDKTPPSVRYTTPVIGAVKFPVKGTVTFGFSEWIDKKTAEKCLSVFPPPLHGIKIKASGKTISLSPAQAFAESTTYHIELNSSLNDLHGNSIGTPFHFFFSTGPSIDSGKIYGCILSTQSQPAQPKAALFAEKAGFFPDSGFFAVPNYLVQTDSSGGFLFDHIRKGRYALIAFIDANNDNRLQPGIERAFASIEKTVTIDSVSGPVILYPVNGDTITNRLISLKPLSNRVIAGIWARPADTMAESILSQWRIQRLDAAPTGCRVKEYLPLRLTPRFLLTLTDTMSVAAYRLLYAAPSQTGRDKTPFVRDSIRFEGVRFADTAPPAAAGFFPQGSVGLKPRMKLAWSKPVAPSRATWIMADSLHDTVTLTLSTRLADTTFFHVQRALKPGALYRLRLPDSLFADVSGNHPRDSAFGNYSVRAIAADDICNSLSGGDSCLRKTARAKWLFMPLGTEDYYVVDDSGGRFRFDSIPAGKGRIGYFVDFNGDARPTSGNLVPWIKPEPYTLFPDTIEARARWDIENIVVEACEACVKKQTPPVSTAPVPRSKPNIKNPLQSIK